MASDLQDPDRAFAATLITARHYGVIKAEHWHNWRLLYQRRGEEALASLHHLLRRHGVTVVLTAER